MAKAYGALIDVLGGPEAFLQWKMIETGMYERLALANGKAIQGLQPKITTWNTGGGKSSVQSFEFLLISNRRLWWCW
jgi:flotillin